MLKPATAVRKVLFLCTANYYRSRFAEYLFNHVAEHEGVYWRAESRGLGVGLWGNIGPISRYTVERLEALGIEPADLRRSPQQVTATDFEEADLVVAVKEAEHRPMMVALFSDWHDRIEYWAIDDLDCAEPHEALPLLECQIHTLVDRLSRQSPRSNGDG
ncbi:MAG: low molecular weight phosphatase family protein [Planctomycetota bacterium]